MWQHWINGLLGLWLAISPFFMSADGLVNNAIAVGIIVAIVAIWGGASERSHEHHERRHA